MPKINPFSNGYTSPSPAFHGKGKEEGRKRKKQGKKAETTKTTETAQDEKKEGAVQAAHQKTSRAREDGKTACATLRETETMKNNVPSPARRERNETKNKVRPV
ncbi:hypothetical protein [Paraburkholderia hayleyella]|uniref:hypothetical protein n=1 Tax=Paraburkholderia hayleyella TaxID=2152889 RepID=UPI001292B8D8|nr:hypothetical protein [Paraburkholderia hayleyella]